MGHGHDDARIALLVQSVGVLLYDLGVIGPCQAFERVEHGLPAVVEVAGLSANPTYRTAKAEGILDAQIGYDFQPGSALEGLSILFQARNLTDRPFITYQNNDVRQVIDYQRYGRDFYVGISYKF